MSAHEARTVIARVPKDLHIAGRWRPASGGGRFTVSDPGTGAALCEVADGTAPDAVAALDAAVAAQPGWAATVPRERAEILRDAWRRMLDRADELARVMTLEMGKSLAESYGEVRYAAEFLRWFAEEAVRVDGRYSRNPTGPGRVITLKQPVGPCLLITPWNFPLAMGTRKIGPAVAAGCTMVVKPARQTPLSMLALAGLLAEAGLPDGVLNVVPASDAAAVAGPLLADPRLRKLSFTGSTAVGRVLMAQAAPHLQRVSLELGGNAPFLVFADADLSAAVAGAVTAKLRNNGESCVAANRFLIAEEIAGEFTARLAARMGSMPVGHGLEAGTQIGPLIDATALHKVIDLVGDAVGRGACAVAGGCVAPGPGHFYLPTVLAGVPRDARILHEEVFGPVAPISTFGTEEEAVELANDTEHGLAAYLYTRDLDRAVRVAERLETGMVGLNTGLVSNAAAPFGGVKASGLGREGGAEGIEEYLSVKYIALATAWEET